MKIDVFKVLILENIQGQYERIRNKLNEKLGGYVQIFPDHVNASASLNNFHALIEEVKESKFEEILKFYNDIDIFIIDNSMFDRRDRKDNIGANFRDYIKRINYRNLDFQIIFVSATYKTDLPFSDWGTEEEEEYIFKMEGVVDESILKAILRLRGIDEKELIHNSSTGIYPEKPLFSLGAVLHFAWYELKQDTARVIDKLINIIFCLLITIATVSGGYNLIAGFVKNSFRAGGGYGEKEETEILKTTEHIYLYLLPIFIVFGFFIYYQSNIRVFLLKGNTERINDVNSTQAMRLTKILFISSIIAYVLIKAIEMLFIGTPDKLRLIGSGILLLILMGYFIFLEKNNKE